MGVESSSGSKRNRAEDEVYLDNYHVHKRYLSEVMASSLNGLTVGDTLSEGSKLTPQISDVIDSPAVTENACFSKSLTSYPSNGDELSTLDSYMSDDSDDSVCFRTGRYYETPPRVFSSLCESSRVSASMKCSKGATSGTGQVVFSSNNLPMSSVVQPCFQSRQRVPDAESRFPPSPSDPCYAADLRRAALLRSLHMRAQSPVAVLDSASPDECLDSSIHGSSEAEDQCSPSSTNFEALSAEQTASNHDIPGSPVHGTFPGQGGRISGRARSLILDECVSSLPATMNDDVGVAFSDTLCSSADIILKSPLNGTDSVHSQVMNLDCSDSSMYREEVSDSMDKTDDPNTKQWLTSRRGQLCHYFYKSVSEHNVTHEDHH